MLQLVINSHQISLVLMSSVLIQRLENEIIINLVVQFGVIAQICETCEAIV